MMTVDDQIGGEYLLRPGLVAALGLVAGHLMAAALDFDRPPMAAAFALLAAGGCLLGNRRSLLFALCVGGFFLAVGMAQEGRDQRDGKAGREALALLLDGGAPLGSVSGRVDEFPRRGQTTWNILLGPGAEVGVEGRTVRLPAPVAVRVRSGGAPDGVLSGIVPGDRIEGFGSLEELPRGGEAGERETWLAGQGAIVVMRASRVSRVEEAGGRGTWRRFLALSQRAGAAAEAHIQAAMPERPAALLVALALGRTHALTQEQRSAFRRSGLMHLFSVSGLHTMLIGGTFLFFLRMIGMRPGLRLVLLVAGLLFFAALVGLRPSVLRAALLLVAYEGAYLLRRPVEPLAALGSIATILMLLTPRLVWQADFQMSFLCAAAIVLMSPWMFELQRVVGHRAGWGWRGWIAVRTLQVLCVSLAIQAMLSPVLARWFGEVSLVAPLGNLLLLGLAGYTLILCFACLGVCVPFPGAGEGLLWLLGWPVRLLDMGAGLVSAIPGAVWRGPSFPVSITACLYMLLLAASWFRYRGRTQPRAPGWRHAPGLAALALLAVWLPLARTPPGALDVWFLDVGQGDAVLVRTPAGRTLLVDAGPDQVAHLLPGMIRHRGIGRLDCVVATHADADHVGGMAELLDEMPAGLLVLPGEAVATVEYNELAEAIVRHRIPTSTIQRGAILDLAGDGARVEVLHPSASFLAAGMDRNDSSIVLRVAYAGRSILLAGDAEEAAEASMIAAGIPLESDVLKAGHHGAATSTGDAFLAAVDPSLIVISCGIGNRFGHPSPRMLDRAGRQRARILRTDHDGTIHLRIDDEGAMTVSTGR